MNWQVVKDLVAYGRELGEDKRQAFPFHIDNKWSSAQ